MHYQVVCFGEILFDIIDDVSNPGGAPFNVAYHLKQAGVRNFLISSVGNDTYGAELLHTLKTWKLETKGIAISTYHKTGKAIVKQGEDGLPEYDIVYPVAWDYIPWRTEFVPIVRNSGAFVFGSLSSRNFQSHNTLQKCLEYSSFNVFDINLRPPHIDQRILEDLLQKTHVLKLNDSELTLLNQWYGKKEGKEEEQVATIRKKFDIEEVILTKGAEGASYYSDHIELHRPAIQVKVADTVGSGDAFLAGFLSKRLDGSSTIEECFLEGIKKGAYVASRYGACPSYEGYKN